MNALALQTVDSLFASVDEPAIAGLLRQRAKQAQEIERLAAAMSSGEAAEVLPHFVAGNECDDRFSASGIASRLFKAEGALKSLDAAHWQSALALTDVWEVLPAKRKQEWRAAISERECPPFSPENVARTFADLLASRRKFFAEKVDGCFRALSGEHVTNRPEGFSKRMIYAGMLSLLSGRSDWWSTNYHGIEQLQDLRAVVAKFMGRDAPSYRTSDRLVSYARQNHGEWIDADGGALRIRVYKKGTAHVEVHPDMAWRLNQVLADLYPRAIPPKHRQPPKRRPKARKLFTHIVPSAVLDALVNATVDDSKVGTEVWLSTSCDKAVKRGAGEVLASLGGVKQRGCWRFDYDARAVLDEVILSGEVPDRRAYQFYPTPEIVQDFVLYQADVREGNRCLEPSAGSGALLRHLPKSSTTFVEISKLHARALMREGWEGYTDDFLEWAPAVRGHEGHAYERIVMNPPFAGGQALSHVEAAATLVAEGGKLVAVLPASLWGKVELEGFKLEWSGEFPNAFAGTSIAVVVLTAKKVKS